MDFSPLATWGIPGFIITVLAGVIVYQNRKIEALYKEKDALQEQWRQDSLTRGTKAIETMQSFSQTVQLIESKLLISKRGE